MAEEKEEKQEMPAWMRKSFGRGFTRDGVGIASPSSGEEKSPRDEALDAAEGHITAGIADAIAAIQAGQEASAAAIIESAKIGAKAVMDAAKLGLKEQKRLFAIADKKLTPFIKQGTEAGRELASMLGIPNDKGVIEPFDIEDLKDTPGYEFVFDESVRAVMQSAIGSKLSSGTADRIQDRAAGLASQTFTNRAELLLGQTEIGQRGATALSQAAANFGSNIGQITSNLGNAQAEIQSRKGAQLADVFTQSAAGIADLNISLGSTLAELELVRGKVSPFFNDRGSGGGGDFGSFLGRTIGSFAGSAAGAAGSSVGGFIGEKVGDILPF